MHHSDTVGLNLRLCDPWMEGASNKTSSHRIRVLKKVWHRGGLGPKVLQLALL